MREKPTVVINTGRILNAEEYTEALAIPSTHPIWRALMQKIDETMKDRAVAAIAFLNTNNALGMAGCNGAVEILQRLAFELESDRLESVKKLS
jgi:hypothetical protein